MTISLPYRILTIGKENSLPSPSLLSVANLGLGQHLSLSYLPGIWHRYYITVYIKMWIRVSPGRMSAVRFLIVDLLGIEPRS